MSTEQYREKVMRELDRLRRKSARSWVQSATTEMVEDFRARKGRGYSLEMCEAIASELERVSTEAA